MSKLSAFLSSVEPSSSVGPASSAPSQDKKAPEPAVEATPEDDEEPAIEDNQAEEEAEHTPIEEEVPAEESATPEVEAVHEPLEKPPSSSKLFAFLQAVEPASVDPPKVEVEAPEEDDDDFVAVEAEEAVSTEEETPAVEEEVAPVEKEEEAPRGEGSSRS